MRFLAALFLFASLLFGAPVFPKLTGVVVDEAGLLNEQQKESIVSKLESFHQTTDAQLVVAVVSSLQGYAINDYGYQLGRYWGIGSKEKNNGLLLIVAPNEREVRIEVGYGLEGVMSDFAASKIIQTIIIPKFKEGKMDLGIVAGVDAMIARIQDPTQSANEKVFKSVEDDPIAKIFFFLIITLIFLSKAFKRFIRPMIPSAFLQFFAYILTHNPIVAIIVFLLAYAFFFKFMKHSSKSSSSWSGGSGGGSSSSSGGFSGGGGNFGGGGSSGKW